MLDSIMIRTLLFLVEKGVQGTVDTKHLEYSTDWNGSFLGDEARKALAS